MLFAHLYYVFLELFYLSFVYLFVLYILLVVSFICCLYHLLYLYDGGVYGICVISTYV